MKSGGLPFCIAATALLMSLLVSGCGGSGGTATPSPDGTSGLTGHITITSHGGPDYAGQPALVPAPYPGTVLAVDSSDGHTEIARVKSDAQGSFSVNLNPGTYLLVPVLTEQEKLSSIMGQSQTVIVKSQQFTTVSVAYSQSIT